MSIKVKLNPLFPGTRDLWLETKIHSLRIKCLTTDIVRLTIRVSVSVSKIRSGQWCCELRRIYNASQGKLKQTKAEAFLKMFHAFLHFILFRSYSNFEVLLLIAWHIIWPSFNCLASKITKLVFWSWCEIWPTLFLLMGIWWKFGM